MIQIEPYQRVGPLSFGASTAEVHRQFGEPLIATTNRAGEVVHRYNGLVLTFDGDGLAEVGLMPEDAPHIGSIPIFSNEGFAQLVNEDGDAREIVGFIVLLKFGLTVTGMHDGDASQLAATAFRKGRWDRFTSIPEP